MGKTNVYVDGFNLYYGCLRATPYRWLDLEAFSSILLPQDDIKRIRYFTARVKARPGSPGVDSRQLAYLRAIGTLPKVSVHFGHFLSHSVRMPVAAPQVNGPKTVEVIKTEEKGSDVNLAAYLLMDAFEKDCDTAVVISNDGDLKEPLRMARDLLRVKVGVVNPHIDGNRSKALAQYADFYKVVRKTALARAQFPPEMTDDRGIFHKPPSW